MTPDDRLLTAAELAAVLHVPVVTVWKWGRSGQVPCLRLPGGRSFVRFELGEVEKALRGGSNGKG